MSQASIAQRLLELQQQNLYRTREAVDGPQTVNLKVNNQSYISFCSNDYLGLANDPRVCHAAKQAIDSYGVGSGASQLICGYTSAHAELEQQLAEFFGYSRCVLFSSGFLANLGVISSLATNNSAIIEDKLNHASLLDAAKYTNAELKRYKHADINHANKIIQKINTSSTLIATDGVFSMEGSIAPLAKLVKLKHSSQSYLIVDDAHGIGVLGASGKGSLEHQSIAPAQVDILIGTLGKSFGVSGAFVLGNSQIIEYIIQKARTLIYTTAAPSALAVAASTSLGIIKAENQRRERLHENINYFRQCAKQTSLNLLDSISAIQSLVIGDNLTALNYSQQLKLKGLLVLAIRPPTVPKNTARLRITITSEHTHEHIDQLITALTNINLL